MSEYKYRSFCVIDDAGFAVDLARVLSKTVENVYYYKEWKQGGFPSLDSQNVGVNIPGVIKVDNLEKLIDNEDIQLFIFVDVYRGAQQVHLTKLGKRVFGSRMAENFEIHRDKGNELIKAIGLPLIPTTEKHGVKELEEHSKEHKNQYVKISKTRGLMETQNIPDYDLAEIWFDGLAKDLGARKDDFKFFCQDKMPEDMSEIGLDPMICGGRIPEIVMGGCEFKDSSYFCVVKPYNDFPEYLRTVVDKLLPVFEEYNYRGNFSYEAKVGKEKLPHVLDWTMRIPQPPGSLQWYMYRKNLADLFYSIAEGIPLSPEITKPYGVEIVIKSETAKKTTLPIRVPKEFRDQVFLNNYTIRDGKDDLYYIIPRSEVELEEVGSVVGEGDTLKEAFDNAKSVCDKIESMDVKFKITEFDCIQKEIDKLDELGINFFKIEPTTDKTPEVEPEKLTETPAKEEISSRNRQPEKPMNPKVSTFLKKIKS